MSSPRIRGSPLHSEGRGRADVRPGDRCRPVRRRGRRLHRLELLLLVLGEQRLEPRVDLFLNLLQSLSSARAESFSVSCWAGEKILPGCGGSPGPGPPGGGPCGAKTLLICCLCAGVSTLSNRPSSAFWRASDVLLLVVRQLQSVLFGAGHDLAGLRRGVDHVAVRVTRPDRGLLLLIRREELVQVGVDVLLDLVELLPLIGGDRQHLPGERRHDLPRPRRLADRHCHS